MKTRDIHAIITIVLSALIIINTPFIFETKEVCDAVGCSGDYKYSFTSPLLFYCPVGLLLTGLITLIIYSGKKEDLEFRWLSFLNLLPFMILAASSLKIIPLVLTSLSLMIATAMLSVIYALFLLNSKRNKRSDTPA